MWFYQLMAQQRGRCGMERDEHGRPIEEPAPKYDPRRRTIFSPGYEEVRDVPAKPSQKYKGSK